MSNQVMKEETKTPEAVGMSADNQAYPSPSAANETAESEIPIARNANPAGVSTARIISDLPLKVPKELNTDHPAFNSSSSPEEYPVARNANPKGVSTSRQGE